MKPAVKASVVCAVWARQPPCTRPHAVGVAKAREARALLWAQTQLPPKPSGLPPPTEHPGPSTRLRLKAILAPTGKRGAWGVLQVKGNAQGKKEGTPVLVSSSSKAIS